MGLGYTNMDLVRWLHVCKWLRLDRYSELIWRRGEWNLESWGIGHRSKFCVRGTKSFLDRLERFDFRCFHGSIDW
jgi:hypothetical protein